jgi:dolichyl-phosphate mannosyltransferase polypeptide 2 regulatory subunit
MLVAATAIFVYYTVWTLFMVCFILSPGSGMGTNFIQPFVDDDHILHSLFLPRVWAIRIPVILIILGTTVVGSFLSVVMIRSNRKKALKAKQKKAS